MVCLSLPQTTHECGRVGMVSVNGALGCKMGICLQVVFGSQPVSNAALLEQPGGPEAPMHFAQAVVGNAGIEMVLKVVVHPGAYNQEFEDRRDRRSRGVLQFPIMLHDRPNPDEKGKHTKEAKEVATCV